MKGIVFIALIAILLGSVLAIKEGTIDDVDKVIFYAIPHSHTDAGWYWTYEYYYGLAKRILDSVTKYLHRHEEARFTWSDHSFFRKWFNEEIKGKVDKEEKVRNLIKTGQLDLINGGLVQNDEASSHMKETYTNLEEGLSFLYEEFGIRPDAYWQLDPFGFSAITPEILKSLGIDKLIINRMSEAYKNVLRENQDLDFIWQGDGDEEIWTHTLPGHYGTDLAFYYDKRWYTSNKCPNPLDKKCVKKLVEESIHQGMKVHNKTGYVMQLIGNDFFFTNAEYSFDYVNGMKSALEKYGSQFLNGKPVEFRYATLSEYLEDMEKLKYDIGRYNGDFFVYTQYHPSRFYDHHWGGYFFSRPMFKWMVRDSLSRERNLHSILSTLNFLTQTNESSINPQELNKTFHTLLGAKEFNPVMLHHDAITGTHGNSVNIDYKRKLQSIQNIMDASTNLLFKSVKTKEKLNKGELELVFYNPSFYTRKEIVNVTLDSEFWSFSEGNNLAAEIMDSYTLDKENFKNNHSEFIMWIEISVVPFSHQKVIIKRHDSLIDCNKTHN